jgi:hypothetical protein
MEGQSAGALNQAYNEVSNNILPRVLIRMTALIALLLVSRVHSFFSTKLFLVTVILFVECLYEISF